MAAVNGIRDAAASVRDSKNAVSRMKSTFSRSSSSASSAWRGETGEAFKDMTKRVQTKLNTILREYGDLNSKLTRLGNSVRKAEAEKNRKR